MGEKEELVDKGCEREDGTDRQMDKGRVDGGSGKWKKRKESETCIV